jgi:hypothetical protein
VTRRPPAPIGAILSWIGLAIAITLFLLAFVLIPIAITAFYALLFSAGVVATFALTGLSLERHRRHARRALDELADGSQAIRVQAGAAFLAHLGQVAHEVLGENGSLTGSSRTPTYLLGSPAGLEIVQGPRRAVRFAAEIVHSIAPFVFRAAEGTSGPERSITGLTVTLHRPGGKTIDWRVPVVDEAGRPFDDESLAEVSDSLGAAISR